MNSHLATDRKEKPLAEKNRLTKTSNSETAKRTIDEATKKAMAQGRERSRIVDLYLKALDEHKWFGRGPSQQTDPHEIESELARLEDEKSLAQGSAKLFLIQEQNNLKAQLDALNSTGEYKRLEAKFISIAKQFSIDRKISYDSWREVGVPVRILNKAGMYPPRGSRILNSSDEEGTLGEPSE